MKAALAVATAGGVGFGPWAPGTWGAGLAVLLFPLLTRFDLAVSGLLVVLVGGLGVWAAGAVEGHFGRVDDGRIVIDEVVGQWITLLPIALLGRQQLGALDVFLGLEGRIGPFAGIDASWLLVVTAFVAFRWFDIRKPGPVRWAERRFEGGTGVMADDVVAGLLGAGIVTLPACVLAGARLEQLAAAVAGPGGMTP